MKKAVSAKQPAIKGKNRREEILKSGRNLFFAKGYRLTTMEEVARRAGYSKRTVYLDFANKDDLLVAVATEGLEILLEQLQATKMRDLPFPEFLDAYIGTVAAFCFSHRDYFKMLAHDVTPEVIAGCSKARRTRAEKVERQGIGLLADALEKAMEQKRLPKSDPWGTAEIIIGAVVGMITLTMGGSQAMFSPETINAKVKRLGAILHQGLLHS